MGLTLASPVIIPTLSGPKSRQRDRNFSFTNAYLNEVHVTNSAGKMALGQVTEVGMMLLMPFIFLVSDPLPLVASMPCAGSLASSDTRHVSSRLVTLAPSGNSRPNRRNAGGSSIDS